MGKTINRPGSVPQSLAKFSLPSSDSDISDIFASTKKKLQESGEMNDLTEPVWTESPQTHSHSLESRSASPDCRMRSDSSSDPCDFCGTEKTLERNEEQWQEKSDRLLLLYRNEYGQGRYWIYGDDGGKSGLEIELGELSEAEEKCARKAPQRVSFGLIKGSRSFYAELRHAFLEAKTCLRLYGSRLNALWRVKLQTFENVWPALQDSERGSLIVKNARLLSATLAFHLLRHTSLEVPLEGKKLPDQNLLFMARCLDAMYFFCHSQGEREDDLPAMSVQTLQEVVFARKNPVSALLGSHTDVSPLLFQTALTAFTASSPTREDLRLFYAVNRHLFLTHLLQNKLTHPPLCFFWSN